MVDLIRCGLFLSIALVGTWWWLFSANFLIGCTAMLWIPAKDSAIPNLLRRKDHVETVNQLSLVMTYGVTAITAFGLYAIVNGINTNLHLWNSQLGVAKVIVIINGLLYFAAAVIVATRIPEISGRSHVHQTPLYKDHFYSAGGSIRYQTVTSAVVVGTFAWEPPPVVGN